MKSLLPVLCALIFLTCAASTQAQGPQGYGSDSKDRTSWFHRQTKTKRTKEQRQPLYTTPKSVGWCQRNPGPAGAGAK